jgi:hypothetical protein
MANGNWSLAGNALGTPPSGFLGTIDNSALVIQTGNPSVERLRVDTSGRVGIGTPIPKSQLHVNVPASQNPISALTIDVQSFLTEPNAQASHFLLVHDIGAAPPNGSTNFAIRGDGYVGIGTAQPSARLSVVLPNTTEIGNIAHSSTLLTSSGSLGTTPGEVALASFGLKVGNDLSFGVRAIRTAAGTDWNSTAIGLGMDVDDTPRAGAALFLHANGNVGIGTSAPVSVLEAAKSAPGALGPALTLTNTGGGANSAVAVDFNTFPESYTGGYNPSSRIEALDDGNFANDIVFLSNQPGKPSNGLVERMRITSAGNVTVPGDILLTGADCAEYFDVTEGRALEPGTVIVIDQDGAIRESHHAYDKKVAGVISGAGEYKHAIILDQRPSEKGRMPVALVGKVYCKVDAEYSPIQVGDLLTTSPTPGHAMKAAESKRTFGAVIGKALRSLDRGQSLIPILIALQ